MEKGAPWLNQDGICQTKAFEEISKMIRNKFFREYEDRMYMPFMIEIADWWQEEVKKEIKNLAEMNYNIAQIIERLEGKTI